MRVLAFRPQNPVNDRSARRASAFLALAAVLVFGATWAKVSHYEARAVPSPHFSASVKIARAIFHSGLDDEPQAQIAAAASLPEPDWNGFALLPDPLEIAGAPPLPSQALRGPPVELYSPFPQLSAAG